MTVKKVADTMDFKASDFPKMADETAQACAYVLSDDLEKDGEEYLSEIPSVGASAHDRAASRHPQ
ncbi:MAG: hypothetical protein V8T10_03150 [Merdibacter sp.]